MENKMAKNEPAIANDFDNAKSFNTIVQEEITLENGEKVLVNKGTVDIAEVSKGKRIKENGTGSNPYKITFPCMTNVKMVPRSKVVANNYNPNSVSTSKMELLATSVKSNGFCFPIVAVYDKETDEYIIIDGFHRFTILGPQYLDCPDVPLVVLDKDITGRLEATVQFNRARGVHKAESDADLIRTLAQLGNSDEEISKSLGMTVDEIKRYKSLNGILDMMKAAQFSRAQATEDAQELGENVAAAGVKLADDIKFEEPAEEDN